MEQLQELSPVRESEQAALTVEQIERFIDSMERRGCRRNSLKKYRRDLLALYEFLPEDKQIDQSTMERWRQSLLERGYAARTVNSCLSVGNRYMEYIKQANWRSKGYLPLETPVRPELSRGEYKRLLQTAKAAGKERLYFMIKTLCCAGLRVHELPEVTYESLRSGKIVLPGRKVRLPVSLRAELSDYADRQGVMTGPVFLTRNGVPLDRTQVWAEIRQLCRDARVAEEKANPRCLWNLYRATQEGIRAGIAVLIEQAYDRLLEDEQEIVGWEEETD